MTEDKTIDHEAREPGTALVQTFDYSNPVKAFHHPETIEALFNDVERKVRSFKHDMSTAASRKRTTALKTEVVRTKTALDEAGKRLNAAKRAEIDSVDEARRKIRDRLDALAEEARAPLTAWEKAEEERQQERDRQMAAFRDAAIIDPDGTAADLRRRLDDLEASDIDKTLFEGVLMEAAGRREQAINALRNGIARIEQAEKDRAELEALRREKEKREAEEAERLEAERIEREKREAAEREKRAREQAARLEAERAERELVAAELAKEAERQRVAEAEKKARLEVEQKAERERKEQQDRHNEEIRRIQQEHEATERAKAAKAKLEREEEAKRQASKKHRTKITREAIESLVDVTGLDQARAEIIVKSIIEDRIAHVSIRF